MKWLSNQLERVAFPRVLALKMARVFQPSLKLSGSDFFWCALLILPLLLTSVWLLATGAVFNVFWAGDETNYHYPLILEFAKQWPWFNFHYGFSATTPLLHMLGATVVELFGAKLGTLRVCLTITSAVGILFVYQFLRTERGLSQFSSWLGAAVLMFSCYFFGYSFRVLTDNLALVFCLLAMGSLYHFLADEAGGSGAYFVGCVWLALAVLTRQSCIFLCVPFAICLFLRENLRPKVRALGVFALGLALLPLIALFFTWKGVVPPGAHSRHTPGGFPFYIHSMALPFCILGFYTLFFHGGEIWDWMKGGWRNHPVHEVRTTLLVVGLSFACASYLLGNNRIYSGFLNTVACQFPSVLGITVLTWLLLQVGLSAAILKLLHNRWWRGRDPGETIGILSFAAICLVSASNGVAAQKYYDAQVLTCLLWELQPAETSSRRWRRSMWILVGLFCIYQAARQSSIAYTAS